MVPYKRLGEMCYDHRTVNHSEGEYASGDNNEIPIVNDKDIRSKLSRTVPSLHLLAHNLPGPTAHTGMIRTPGHIQGAMRRMRV